MVCTRFLCEQFRDTLIVLIRSAPSTHSMHSANLPRSVLSANLPRSAHSVNFARFAYFAKLTRFAPLALFPAIFELRVHRFPYSGNTRLPPQGPNLEPSVE